jgi:hypothetical protein
LIDKRGSIDANWPGANSGWMRRGRRNRATFGWLLVAAVFLLGGLALQAEVAAGIRTCNELAQYHLISCVWSFPGDQSLFELPDLAFSGQSAVAVVTASIGALAATMCAVVGLRRMRRLLTHEDSD